MNLKSKRLFLLDMDGTIYLDNELFDGTLDFLDYVKSIGGKYLFMTNNSSKGAKSYVEKLSALGIPSSADDFLTSADAAELYLKRKNYKKIYVLGTGSFKQQLHSAGLCICDELCEDIDCLCMGFDTELTFKKLEDACILLNKSIDYIATNPDWVCPTYYGYVPDCGSVSEMLYRATGKKPYFLGKPQPQLPLLALEKYGFKKEEAVIIGDRLYTDIACGVNAGIDTIFVLSGEGTMETLAESEVKPSGVYTDIRQILSSMTEND